MPHTPLALYTAAQVRKLDRFAIEQCQVPSFQLMEEAAQAGFNQLQKHWPQARKLAIICGLGNNAGDGYCLASRAMQAGLIVCAVAVADPQTLKGDAKRAFEQYNGPCTSLEEALSDADVIVDALLGTGLDRPVTGQWATLIDTLNDQACPILSLDIPSGLCVDTGQPQGVAIKAQATITFVGNKQGLYTGQGPDYAGEVSFADLGIPAEAYESEPPSAHALYWPHLKTTLAPRAQATHKGQCGHVLIIGGAPGMSGSVRLAGEAALRVGAGRVSIATHPEHAAVLNSARPELMCHAIHRWGLLQPLIEVADVIVIGPGLSQERWGLVLMQALKQYKGPLLCDADALNWIAKKPKEYPAQTIFTPHPGEAARLLKTDVPTIEADRFAAIHALRQRYGATCVLKGCGTLIKGDSATVGLCAEGNPGMATAGMGDVLCGVIAGLWAQGLDAQTASMLGVSLHAHAADQAAEKGMRGLIASDIMPYLQSGLQDIP